MGAVYGGWRRRKWDVTILTLMTQEQHTGKTKHTQKTGAGDGAMMESLCTKNQDKQDTT